jgi:hypothetical protein
LCDELQHKIDHNHSYAQQNLDAIHDKLANLESLPNQMSKLMVMQNQILTSQSLGYQWSDQPSQKEGVESSNPSGHHSTPLVHDQMTHMWHKLPKVDLNKFDGSTPQDGSLRWNITFPCMASQMT